MDEPTLRQLAADLLAELPDKIPDDAERGPVAQKLRAALDSPEGEGSDSLLKALEAYPETRKYMREHGAYDDVVRSGLPGITTTPVGLYYVCPEGDEDDVLLTIPASPPPCPVHGIPMILQG